VLAGLKFISWVVSLGSGTSGGTLAPLFTIGGGVGSLLGTLGALVAPSLGLDVKIAALVGMAAMFAGASRALLASVVFAFETTRQPIGLLPLLGGCTSAFLLSCLMMRNSIMTEKIVRRGVRVLGEYTTDFLDQIYVRDHALRPVVTVREEQTVADVRSWLASGTEGCRHQGFPVVDHQAALVGVITRRDLERPTPPAARIRDLVKRRTIVIYHDNTLREAADAMARERIGRLPVVSRAAPRQVIGIITRSDLVEAHARRLEEHRPHE
jgi:CBS domain-containing protein